MVYYTPAVCFLANLGERLGLKCCTVCDGGNSYRYAPMAYCKRYTKSSKDDDMLAREKAMSYPRLITFLKALGAPSEANRSPGVIFKALKSPKGLAGALCSAATNHGR